VNTFLRLLVLIHTIAASTVLSAQTTPSALYTVDLSSLVPKGKQIYLVGSLTFLTDHTLALSMCSNAGCNLETIDLQGENPRLLARSDEFENYRALFRAPGGGVVLDHVRTEDRQGAVLLDAALKSAQLFPKIKFLDSRISTSGETFVEQLNGNLWVVSKMDRPPVRIRTGTGRALCISDDAVVYLNDGTVHVEGLDGKSLGEFGAGLSSERLLRVHLLGRDRLWFASGSVVEIRSFDGRVLRKLKSEDGWGFREGQTLDGSRLLYDRYTRHVSIGQRIKEDATAIATMGMGVADEEANGEMVRVIDTVNGKQCFEWDGTAGILLAGDYHADIDPSGRFVAIMTRANLRIYPLPKDCSTQ